MAYREWSVRGALAGLVECGWSSTPATRGSGSVAAILPDGCMDILWSGTELVVAGPDTRPHPHRRPSGAPAAGLRFAPGRLPALLGVPAAELRDRRVPLADLHPRLAGRAVARLVDAAGTDPPTGLLAALADVALALPGNAPDPAVPVLAAHLDSPTAASAADLADALGWTSRTLHRRCLAAFGYGPAVLRRVLRFRRATGLLAAGVPAAQVAARAGYADQPHLSRELRALAGTSPGRFAAG